MMRPALLILTVLAIGATPALAQSRRKPDAETAEPTKGTTKGKAGKPDKSETDAKAKGSRGKDGKAKETDAKASGKDAKGKPQQVGTFGDWGAFTAQGKGKTCYALAEPRDRLPASLKRDKAYIFISNRPGENVRSEVSIIMGFAMKDNSDAKAEIGTTTFDLICKGTNAWVKNAAKEGEFIEALKRGSKLVIKASSTKGSLNTDSYSLGGLSEALARVQKDCP